MEATTYIERQARVGPRICTSHFERLSLESLCGQARAVVTPSGSLAQYFLELPAATPDKTSNLSYETVCLCRGSYSRIFAR